VRARPEGVGEDDVRLALAEGWRIDAAAMRYAAVGGGSYHVDPAGLALYRLRWALDDISAFVNRLRTEHRRTADTEHAWLALKETVAGATPRT
jgi:hypothetical protein